ncbi:MAG: hypothetical protein KJO38_11245, partial [Gammaproteobacteria bacterium]|nr:hypothetical protein [Gammaproteobacteria bacterium]
MKICRCLCVASACLLLPPAAPAAPPAFHDAVLADAPLLHYRLGETAGDAVNYGALGAAYDAAYLGTPARGAATLAGDGGVAFDGADDYLESNAVTPAALGGNPAFTAEAVVFIPAGGSALNWAPFLHWGDSSGSSAQNTGKSVYFGVSRNLPHRYYAGFYNGGLRTVGTVAQGVWHHVVWVREAGGTD